MAKTEMIRARVEPELKQAAESVLKELGLTPTEAITLFYKQVTLKHGLPFAVELPNAETRAAMQDAIDGRNLTEWEDLEALKAANR
ncbi:MAG: type II toxin-antitoxin system RelB/DinJ family antitoxin [Defluviicoccus sp.]